MTRKLTEVVCTKIVKQTRPAKALVFRLTAVWSDGVRNELSRHYVEVFDFQTKLGETFKGQADCQMPEIPAARKFERNFLFGNSVEKKRCLVEDYFKRLLQLPDCVHNSEVFRQFFEPRDSDSSNGWATTTDRSCKASVTNTTPIDYNYNDINDSGAGHYESVRDLDMEFASKTAVQRQPSNDTFVDTATAEEHIYWACKDYNKRSSGEVTLCAGSSLCEPVRLRLNQVEIVDSILSTQRKLTWFSLILTASHDLTFRLPSEGRKVGEWEGWWFVEVQDGNQQGWAPASLLLPADRRYLDDIPETKPLEEYQTVCDYTGSGPDEISYRKNDKVKVLEATLDGWWKVNHSGHVGYTPAINLVPVTSESDPSADVYHHHSIYSKKSPPPRRDYEESIDELYARVDKLRRPTQPTVNSMPDGDTSTSADMALYAEIEPTAISLHQRNPSNGSSAAMVNHPANSQPPPRHVPGLPSKSFNPPAALPPPATPEATHRKNSMSDSDASKGAGPRKPLPGVPGPSRSPPPPSSPAQLASQSRPKPPVKPSLSKNDKVSADGTVNADKSPPIANSAFEFFQAADGSGNRQAKPPPPSQQPFNRQKGPPAIPTSSSNGIKTASQTGAPTTTKTNPTSGPRNNDAQTASSNRTVPGPAGKASSVPIINIGRADCDEVLLARGNAQDYIVRHSTKPGCPYALSVHCGDRVLHFPIELTVDRKYYIGKFSFNSLEAVIDYYSSNTLCNVAETGNDIMLGHLFQVCRL